MKINYYELLGMIQENTNPKYVYLILETSHGREEKYEWDKECCAYLLCNKSHENESYDFYLRDSLLDGQSFDYNIEIPRDEDNLPLGKIYSQEEFKSDIKELLKEIKELKTMNQVEKLPSSRITNYTCIKE